MITAVTFPFVARDRRRRLRRLRRLACDLSTVMVGMVILDQLLFGRYRHSGLSTGSIDSTDNMWSTMGWRRIP